MYEVDGRDRVVELNDVLPSSVGAPLPVVIDEAFRGHPLASRGLHPYAAFRVEDSSWVRRLECMNAVHDSHDPERFTRCGTTCSRFRFDVRMRRIELHGSASRRSPRACDHEDGARARRGLIVTGHRGDSAVDAGPFNALPEHPSSREAAEMIWRRCNPAKAAASLPGASDTSERALDAAE